MANRSTLGGVVHTYQKYNPAEFPPPAREPPDLVSGAFEHALAYGKYRELTDEELARAVHLDPSQFANLGPSIDMLRAMLEQRKRAILEKYEADTVSKKADKEFRKTASSAQVAKPMKNAFQTAVRQEQIYQLERLWYQAGDDNASAARDIMRTIEALGNKYQIEELQSKYPFFGHESMTIPQALEIKKELEEIDDLLKQLEEAEKSAQIGIIDMEALSKYAEPGDMQQLEELSQSNRKLCSRDGRATGARSPGGWWLQANSKSIQDLSSSTA